MLALLYQISEYFRYFRDESHINTNHWGLYVACELRKHSVPLLHECPYLCEQNHTRIWSQSYRKPIKINNSDVWFVHVLVPDTKPWSKINSRSINRFFHKGSHDPDSRLYCKVLIDTCGVGSVTEDNLPRREKMPRAPVVVVGKEDEQLRESAQGTRRGRGQHTRVTELLVCSY